MVCVIRRWRVPVAFRINKTHGQDTPAVVSPSAFHSPHVPLISEIQTLEVMEGDQLIVLKQASPVYPPFVFIFKTSSIGGRQSQSLPAVVLIWRTSFDAGAWRCHGLSCMAYSSSWDLWLPWLGVVRALPA